MLQDFKFAKGEEPISYPKSTQLLSLSISYGKRAELKDT
jgi:hypothetical protein